MSNYRKIGFLFPLIVFALGLYYMHESWHLYTNTEYLKESAVETEGVVIKSAANDKGSTKIRYEVEGEEYILYTEVGATTTGEAWPVYYDPLDPENSLSSLQYYNIRNYIGVLLAGIILCYIGGVGMYRILFVR